MGRILTAPRIRRLGLLVALESLALAALLDSWQVSFLIGIFVLGVGIGIAPMREGGLDEAVA